MMTDRDRELLSQVIDWDPPADIVTARESWEAHAAHYLNDDLPKIGVFHEQVDLGGGLKADISVPAGKGPFPVVLYLHGGGWSFGSARSTLKVGMTFADHGVMAVNLDYRLAPEHPFPAALDDVRAAVDWIGRHAADYGADGSRMAVGGDSAGANLALAAALREPEAFRRRLSALLLLYGVYDLNAALERVNNHPGLVAQVKNYAGATAISDPLVSPLFAEMPSNLPPCLIIEGSVDRFVGGEAAILATKLARAGVRHELMIVDGMPHAFLQLFQLDGCQAAWRAMLEFLRKT
ncbi:MAG TPA: alpha/beta hydrolase [Reyranella sp.]|nr:alpha/beta hydrolase [Reyranella sp.]